MPMQKGNDERHPEIMAMVGVPGMIRDFDKPAGKRCKHQRHGKGCAVYEYRPMGCRIWSCRWLVGDDTADLRRPDRAHYVIDMMPDFVSIDDDRVQVVQIWIDPDYPDAHRDPALREYIERRGRDGILALVRFSPRIGMLLIPPNMASDGQWHELVLPEATAPQWGLWPDEFRKELASNDQ
jgi:hypothetical protein